MNLRILPLALLMMSLPLSGCDRQNAAPEMGSAVKKERKISPTERGVNQTTAPLLDTQRDQLETNHLPKIKSTTFIDPYIHHGVDIEVVTEAEDLDLDPITLDYRWFLNGNELSEEKRAILSGDLFSKGDKVSLWITPSDQYGPGKIFYGSEIIIPNAPPVFSIQNEIVIKGDVLSCTIKATDPDNDHLDFVLENAPEGMTINRDSGHFFWARKSDQPGPYHISIIVKDEDGAQSVLPVEIGAQIEK